MKNAFTSILSKHSRINLEVNFMFPQPHWRV